MLVWIIPLMAILSRMSGGGLGAHKIWSRLPELLFTIPFGVAGYLHTDYAIFGVVAWVWSFFMMEMGHGTFYKMTGYINEGRTSEDKPRTQTIEKIVRPIYVYFGGNIDKPLYSWVCMGFKGFLIGLPLGFVAFILALLWPVAYWIGQRVEGLNNAVAEYLSGTFAGTICFIVLIGSVT